MAKRAKKRAVAVVVVVVVVIGEVAVEGVAEAAGRWTEWRWPRLCRYHHHHRVVGKQSIFAPRIKIIASFTE
ncbi:hypothetical protein E2C01_001062 [Portunus trituberculatus]|uniref:Secreted protein n=1 Tax=Portunus trituberculatus TaxID=210409 RepID=A0A5B7CGT7_PORTR|nr:hypothetical protein [Portunus trituberculatus]